MKRILAGSLAVLIGFAAFQLLPRLWIKMKRELRGVASVQDRLDRHGEAVRGRWAPHFQRAGLDWPPQQVVLVGFKREKQLAVYAANTGEKPRLVRTYPILAASGGDGPKLNEGDRQVPEGFYRIEELNPNSRFHLSLRIDYPNAFDHEQAAAEGRSDLGGDIMIHGNQVSVGCLAMGDEAAEDLFVLAAETGLASIRLLLCPADFRQTSTNGLFAAAPEWMHPVYRELEKSLAELNP